MWLFVTDQNASVDQRTIRHSFKAACKRAGPHGFRLRATYASHLLSVLKFYAKFLPSRTVDGWIRRMAELGVKDSTRIRKW